MHVTSNDMTLLLSNSLMDTNVHEWKHKQTRQQPDASSSSLIALVLEKQPPMLSSYLYLWSLHKACAWWRVMLDVALKRSSTLWSSTAGGLMIGCASADFNGGCIISQLSSAAVIYS